MTIQTEFLELRCESYGEFLTRVNARLSQIGNNAIGVEFVYTNHDLIAIIKVLTPDKKEVEALIKKYTQNTKEAKSL